MDVHACPNCPHGVQFRPQRILVQNSMTSKRVNRQWLPEDCKKDEWYTEYDMTFVFLNDIYTDGATEGDIESKLAEQLGRLEKALELMYSRRYFWKLATLVSVRLTYMRGDNERVEAEFHGLVEYPDLVRTVVAKIKKAFGGRVSTLRLTTSWGNNVEAIKILHQQDSELHNPKDRSIEGQRAEVDSLPFTLDPRDFRPMYINFELLHYLFRELVFDVYTKRLRLMEITEVIPIYSQKKK